MLMKCWEQCLACNNCPVSGSLQNVLTYLLPRCSEANLHQAGPCLPQSSWIKAHFSLQAVWVQRSCFDAFFSNLDRVKGMWIPPQHVWHVIAFFLIFQTSDYGLKSPALSGPFCLPNPSLHCLPPHSLQPTLAFVQFSLPSPVFLRGFGRCSPLFLERSFLVFFPILLTPSPRCSCFLCRAALPITLSNIGHRCPGAVGASLQSPCPPPSPTQDNLCLSPRLAWLHRGIKGPFRFCLLSGIKWPA